MSVVAEVCVNLPARSISKTFSYVVPDNMAFVDVGWRVLVPFGSRMAEGFVVSAAPGSEDDLKPLAGVIDTEPWFTPHMLAVAAWLSDYYLCTRAEAMRLFIPGKAGIKAALAYRAEAVEGAADYLESRPPIYRKVYEYVADNGPKSLPQVSKVFGESAVKVLRQLCSQGMLVTEAVVRKTAQARFKTFWRLAVDNEAAAAMQESLKRKPAQSKLIAALLQQETLTAEELRRLNLSPAAVKSLLAAGIIAAGQTQLLRDSYRDMGGIAPEFTLTGEQQQVLAEIIPSIETRQACSFLLYGITGSGKTQIYIEAVAKARRMGRQAVVLVPEIALTGQIVTRFKERFGEDVLVLHSKLSLGERYDTWQRLKSGSAGIVIGARSAVFAPVSDPGVFIIDEEHEFTYKQEESPHYHTRDVALKRAELAGAAVILGSATPAVETYYQALAGKHRLLSMESRIDGAVLPEVTVVDMREELKAGRRSVISAPLQELLAETMAQREQAIVLLNRRGYATFVLCRECGHVMQCRHCAVSLVYHQAAGTLRCHYCQGSMAVPDVCPACGSRYIRYFGTGTQKVEEELASLLPGARIVRMDQDTTGGKLAHDKILAAFAAGKYDILLGTQMVAKGHDIKNVTAVGIISADTALHLPDFRAAERTFNLLTQAAGRAGRGDKPGRVVVQTYNPEHYAIQSGARHDYPSFYRQELECRQELLYPPCRQLIKITVDGNDETKARRRAEDAAAELRRELAGSGTDIIGPFAAPVAKISDIYRLHILLKAVSAEDAKAAVRKLELTARGDVAIDVDPLNVL